MEEYMAPFIGAKEAALSNKSLAYELYYDIANKPTSEILEILNTLQEL